MARLGLIQRALRQAYREARAAGVPDEITHGYLRFGPDGMTEAARMGRAREMGMERMYRGMQAPQRGERMGWASGRGDTASTYALDDYSREFEEGANVMPLMVRTDDLPTIEGRGRMFDRLDRRDMPPDIAAQLPDYAATPDDIAQAAFDAGRPGVRITSVIDDNTPTLDVSRRLAPDTTAIRQDGGYRSVHAAFDPRRRAWRNLLAASSTGAPIGLLALMQMRDREV